MSISIIIATKERHELLILLLQSISKSTLSNFEVIIVDQSKITFSIDKEYSFPILILKHSDGASISRNFGAQYAKFNYLWFLDDDCTLDFNSEFNELTNHMIYFVEWQERKKSNFLFNLSYYFPLLRTIMFIRGSGAPFYIIKKSLFYDIGGYDSNLGPGCKLAAAEDLDLCLRSLQFINKFNKNDYKFISKILLHHKLDIHNSSKRNIYLESRIYVYKKLKIKNILLYDLIYSIIKFDFERYRILRYN